MVVPALNGEPGIYSARLAGLKASDEENVAELLRRMEKLKDIERRAFFVCVMTLVRHEFDPLPIITTGKWEGLIIDSPMGEEGFGYDSIFFDQYTGKTAGQMDKEEKFSLSHRGNALKLMLERLKNF